MQCPCRGTDPWRTARRLWAMLNRHARGGAVKARSGAYRFDDVLWIPDFGTYDAGIVSSPFTTGVVYRRDHLNESVLQRLVKDAVRRESIIEASDLPHLPAFIRYALVGDNHDIRIVQELHRRSTFSAASRQGRCGMRRSRVWLLRPSLCLS